jgi:tRNA-dihydrouridine synthase 3
LDPTPITEKVDARDLNNDHMHMDDAAEGRGRTTPGESEVSGRDAKRRKTKKDRGQNKARQFPIIRETGPQLCRQWEKTGECGRKNCKFQHGWDGYFTHKPSDVRFDPEGTLSAEEPFVEHNLKAGEKGGEDEVGRTIELGTTCPVMRDLGYCPYGWRCRFLGGHVRRLDMGAGEASSGQVFGEWELLGQPSKDESNGRWRGKEINWPDNGLFARLRTNEVSGPDRLVDH